MKKVSILIFESAIIFIAIIWICSGLKTVFLGDTLTSRLATVYALTYHHTWYINRPPELSPNPFESRTVDKVQGKNGIISSKPPILSLLMTGEYQFIKHIGYSLDNYQDYKSIARIMIFLNVILPFCVAILLLWKFLYEIQITPLSRIVILLGLLYGTQWSAFASHFTNHVPATAFLIIGLYFVWKSYNTSMFPPVIHHLLIGLFTSLVYTIDLPLTIFIACAILFLLIKKGIKILPGIAIGALPILVIHLIIMYHITGNILPVQISKAPFLFESSYWRHPAGPDALHHSRWLYAFNILSGAKGLFILYPILIFGLCSYLPKTWKSINLDTKTVFTFFLLSFMMLNIYYIFSTNNYGGVSYGFRWHIGCMPLLLLVSIPYIEKRQKKTLFWLLWITFFVISFYSTYECRIYPWSVNKEWTIRLIFGPLI